MSLKINIFQNVKYVEQMHSGQVIYLILTSGGAELPFLLVCNFCGKLNDATCESMSVTTAFHSTQPKMK